MIAEGTNDFSPAYSAWFGKPVVLLVVIRRCHVPMPCRIVAESVADVRVRIHPGWEMDIKKGIDPSRGRSRDRCGRPSELTRPARVSIDSPSAPGSVGRAVLRMSEIVRRRPPALSRTPSLIFANVRRTCDVTADYSSGAVVWWWGRLLRLLKVGKRRRTWGRRNRPAHSGGRVSGGRIALTLFESI